MAVRKCTNGAWKPTAPYPTPTPQSTESTAGNGSGDDAQVCDGQCSPQCDWCRDLSPWKPSGLIPVELCDGHCDPRCEPCTPDEIKQLRAHLEAVSNQRNELWFAAKNILNLVDKKSYMTHEKWMMIMHYERVLKEPWK